jgi:hypothetical protein
MSAKDSKEIETDISDCMKENKKQLKDEVAHLTLKSQRDEYYTAKKKFIKNWLLKYYDPEAEDEPPIDFMYYEASKEFDHQCGIDMLAGFQMFDSSQDEKPKKIVKKKVIKENKVKEEKVVEPKKEEPTRPTLNDASKTENKIYVNIEYAHRNIL